MLFLFSILSPSAHAEIGPRAGIATGAGGFSGPMISFDGYIQGGAQFAEPFGAFLEIGTATGFSIGGNLSQDGGELRVGALGGRYGALMAEGSIGPFFVTAGPTLNWISWGSVLQGADTDGNVRQYAVVTDGVGALGGQARLGFLIGAAESRVKGTVALGIRATNGVVVEGGQTVGPDGIQQGVVMGDRRWGTLTTLTVGADFR